MSDKAEKIAVIDFECNPAKYKVRLKAFVVGWFDGINYEYFWHEDEKKVLAWAAKKVSTFPGITYAHNGGRFDFLGFLFRSDPKLLYGQKARLIGSRIVQMKYGVGEIRDSYAILPAPLAAYDKGEIADYSIFEPDKRDRHRTVILEYLQRDCVSLYHLVSAFLERHGTRPLTAASAGMRFAKELGYDLPRLSEHQDATYRQFYFGGRVEAFQTGCIFDSFSLYDIKSAYPHAMRHQHAASNIFEFIANPDIVQNTDFVSFTGKVSGCFARRVDGILRYPRETGDYMVTGWEYNEACLCGLVGAHRVNYVERPKDTSDFKRYVDFWFEEKERAEREGDTAGRLIAKIMLNALYGKYAQRPDRWREFVFVSDKMVMTPDHLKEGWEEEYIDEENHFAVWSQPSKRPKTYYNVATAASITGFVRARIMRAVHEWSPFYTDTDSVILNHRVESGAGIGSWGLEVEGDFLACSGKKLYALRVLPRYAPDAKTAKKKGYYWQKRAFSSEGVIFPPGRAWKLANKGCRMTPAEHCRVALGETVETFNEFPTFSMRSGVSWTHRNISKTA